METIAALGALEAFIKRDRKVPRGNYVSGEVSSLQSRRLNSLY